MSDIRQSRSGKAELEPAVLDWLARNLAIERPKALIRDKLLREGYTERAILEAMGADFPTEQDELLDIKDYKALAQPNLVRDPDTYGAERVDCDGLQIYTIPSFLEESICAELVELGRSHCKPSLIKGGQQSITRTSSTSNLYAHMSPLVAQVNQKISSVLGVGVGFAEPLQAQLYNTQQEYQAHVDFLPTQRLKQAKRNFELSGQRSWTFMVYLTNTRRGGETVFPKLGLRFSPEVGSAVVWNNLLADGKPNVKSLHQGCPVEKGTKMILTRWFRTQGIGEAFIA